MDIELKIYKTNRINELKQQFNGNIKRLNNTLKSNITKIRSLRIPNKNKNIRINNVINQYKNQISVMRNNLNISISKLKEFNPEFNTQKSIIQNKKALLIGINYTNTPYQLNGCIDDVNRMSEFLKDFNDIKILNDLTQTKPTKVNILNEFKNLLINSNSDDLLFFYFSGHGSYIYDKNNDEQDKKDEMIIGCDFNQVIDDELKSTLINYLKKDVTIFCLFDSCHSGTMLDLKYTYLDTNNYDKYSENNNVTECQGNVIMISGCMDNQTSEEAYLDNKPQGVMSWSFIQVLTDNPNCSWRELLKSMRQLIKTNGFNQIPQLSTDSIYNIDSKVFI